MALNFVNGTSTGVRNDTGAPVTTFPITMMAWARMTEATPVTNDFNIMQLQDKDSDGDYFRFGLSDVINGEGNLHAAYSGSGNWHAIIGTTVITTNLWFHAAAVFNSVTANDLHIYYNGVNDDDFYDDTPIGGPQNIDSICVGYEADSTPGDTWRGDLAEAAVYAGALTAAEIRAAMVGSPLMSRPDILVGYWPLWGRETYEHDLVGNLPLTKYGVTTVPHPPIRYNRPYFAPIVGSGVTVVDLYANNISASTPTLTLPTIAQIHAINANDLSASTPTLSSPSVFQLTLGLPAAGLAQYDTANKVYMHYYKGA